MSMPKISFFLAALLLLFVETASAAPPQTEQQVRQPAKHIPILYEAYYPETREWNPQSSLHEIEKLRELTNRLLREEEELEQLAAAAVESVPENVFEPRSQILEYVFSRPEPAPVQVEPVIPEPVKMEQQSTDDVQVTSIMLSESAPRHRTRHHHGQADWLVRRLAANSQSR